MRGIHTVNLGAISGRIGQPDFALPPETKEPRSAPEEITKEPKQKGFHGKTQLSYQEASDLSALLDVVLAPLSPEEAAKEIPKEACLRDLQSEGGFPLVDRLQKRLKDFIAAGNQAATFEISHGEVVVTGKAVECAEALGRVKTLKTVAYVGGAAAGGAGLLLLLGLL